MLESIEFDQKYPFHFSVDEKNAEETKHKARVQAYDKGW